MPKINQFYSKNYFKIIILVIIVIVLIVIGILFSQKQNQNNYSYAPDNTEVEVQSSQGEMPESQSTTNDQNIDNNLGPAKTNDIMGGTNASEFYQAPSTEKLLEGKDIEINK